MGSEGFGRGAADTTSAAQLLELELENGRAARFETLDLLTGEVFVEALRGGKPVTVEGTEPHRRGRPGTLRITNASTQQRDLLDENFSVERQQSRGTWSLPDTVTAKVGVVHFASNLTRYERFAHGTTVEDRYKVSLASSPDALYFYSVLEPLFDSVYEPFALRGEQTAKKGREDQIRRWQAIDEFFASIGLDPQKELMVMRYGGGWSRLRAAEQVNAKARLLEALKAQASPAAASRHRAYRLRPLIARYYKRADSEGKALRRRVLTRELERTISAYFGGGWLDFLDYLGEAPHPDEHVATALPEAKLYLGTTRKSANDLGVEGLDEEHLGLIAASLYGGVTSPVERRIEVMERYWEVFDSVHARQESGMEPLWGLVSEDRRVRLGPANEGPYRHSLYERLLPKKLSSEIEDMWGSKMVPRSPERLVTEPFPHTAMAESFGPALKFWHGCALTAWFLCEGPYSRTDLAGIESYHRRELDALNQLGTPVDGHLFSELIAAGSRLGPEMPLRVDQMEIEPGLTLEMSFTAGTRQEGFEILRDVITEHRRSWARAHLRHYLSRCVEREVRGAAEAFYKMTHDRSGKAPTARQFARVAAGPANRWFGGDVSALYRSFGEKSPVSPERVRLVPKNVHAFVRNVFTSLGGTEERLDRFGADPDEAGAGAARAQKNHEALDLAALALEYVQLEESLGRAPSLKEIGSSKFERRSHGLLGRDTGAAYAAFMSIVSAAGQPPKAVRRPGRSRDGMPQNEPTTEELASTTSVRTDREPQERPNNASSQESVGHERTAKTGEGPKRRWWQRLFGR